MKRLLICLAIVSLLVVPAMAQESVDSVVCPIPCPIPFDKGADVQGYVEGSYSAQAGCIDVFSFEAGCKHVVDVSTSCNYSNFDCDANVPRSNCGLSLDRTKFETNFNCTSFNGFASETVNANYATGAADVVALGGVAICASPGMTADAAANYSAGGINTATTFGCNPGCIATSCSGWEANLDLNTATAP